MDNDTSTANIASDNMTDTFMMTTQSIDLFLPTLKLPDPESPIVDRIDAQTAKLVEETVSCYIQPIISLFGIVGNLLSFIILFSERKKFNSNLLLLGESEILDKILSVTSYIHIDLGLYSCLLYSSSIKNSIA